MRCRWISGYVERADEFRLPMMRFADYRAHWRVLPRGLQARPPGVTPNAGDRVSSARSSVEAAVRPSGQDSTLMLTTSAFGIAATAVPVTRAALSSNCPRRRNHLLRRSQVLHD